MCQQHASESGGLCRSGVPLPFANPHPWLSTRARFSVLHLSKIMVKNKCCVLSRSVTVVSDPLQPHGLYVARQAPLPMRCSRQEHWSRVLFPSPGDFSRPRDQTCISASCWSEDHTVRTRVLRVPKVSKMLAGPRIWSVACGKKCERHMGTPEMWRVVLLQGYIKCSEELRRSKKEMGYQRGLHREGDLHVVFEE